MFFRWEIKNPFVIRLVQPQLADAEHMSFAKDAVFLIHFRIYGRVFFRDTFAHNTHSIHGINKRLSRTFEKVRCDVSKHCESHPSELRLGIKLFDKNTDCDCLRIT